MDSIRVRNPHKGDKKNTNKLSSTKRIAVVTGSDSTKNRVLQQLEKLIESHAVLDGYVVGQGVANAIEADLIVFTSQSLENEIQTYIDPKCPKILARRAIDGTHLDQLFALRKGTHALLVNDSKESTDESIALLNLLGFDNITWLPWYPEMKDIEKNENLETCHLAVTLGERELVPDGLLHIIDLGPRIIDLSTIIEILHELNLLDEKSHYLSATYFATIVKMGKTIHKAMADQEQLNERLSHVLHQINDGLFAYDRNGMVKVFSQKCEIIFGLRSDRVIGKPIAQMIKNEYLLHCLKDPLSVQDQLIKIDNEDFALQRFSSGIEEWTVCTLKNLNDVAQLDSRRRRLHIQKGHYAKYSFENIIHRSKIMDEAIKTGRRLAETQLSILIFGESGTGKELFASAIHKASPVKEGPFVAVNFSALPEELVESELFGYEEGAFTGARKGGKPGLFEQANGGTLFLDEIGDISLKIQARLLRVLQEKEVMRLGGTEIIPVNVRIIAATNKPLREHCDQNLFREDLYYRLKRLVLKVPPLRERKEDIPILVQWFLKKNDWQDRIVDETLMTTLSKSPWRGNVRELESVVEYLVAVSENPVLTEGDLPADFEFAEMGNEVKWGTESPDMDNGDINWGNRTHKYLLSQIAEANQEKATIGRAKLSQLCSQSGFDLSEDQVRGRLSQLAKNGFIIIPKGRKGPLITSKGLEWLARN